MKIQGKDLVEIFRLATEIEVAIREGKYLECYDVEILQEIVLEYLSAFQQIKALSFKALSEQPEI